MRPQPHPPNPSNPSLLQHREYYTMRDLRRNRQMAGMLFNVLFNLNKFVQFETRDPFTARQASLAASRAWAGRKFFCFFLGVGEGEEGRDVSPRARP